MWKDTHLTLCIEALKGRGKKIGDSILKSTSSQNNIAPTENNEGEKDGEEITDKKEEENESQKSSQKPDETVKEEEKGDNSENSTTEKNDKTENQENTEKPDETEKEGESNASPSQRPDTTKSASVYSTTSKKTKTLAEDPNTETQTQGAGITEMDTSGSTVLFEEDAYLRENKSNYIDVDTFITLIKQFFDENEELVVLDHLHEYDDEIAEAFRAATDINYDPFLEKLKKTLEQYENTLIKGDFRDDKEREATENIIQDLRDQITKISQSRNQSRGTDREVKKKPLTLEELRERGLREIFTFYSKQHLPEGLEFGDILNKMEVIDLGEFCIFARDFGINIPKKKMIEIVKKTSNLRHQPLNFKQF